MKLIHRFSLFVIVVLVSLPLVIMAQDNGQPAPPTLTVDQLLAQTLPPDVPTMDPDSIQPAQSATPELIDYPTATLDIQPARSPTPELIDYPTTDPCTNPSPEDELLVPLCPPTPTATQRPRPTTQPTTKIVNGLWVLDPNASTFKSSGQCQIPGGDNGGMGGEYQPDELPTVPACMTHDNLWLSIDGNGPYPLTISNYYSVQQMTRELLESNGETVSSINVTITRQFHVISPTEIELEYIRHENGGCTTTSTVRYKLVEANDLVCTGMVMTPAFTPVPTSMPTPQPGETEMPPVTPEPPIQTGEYTIQLPPVDSTCKADQMPPADKVSVGYDSNQNMVINVGSGSYTLFWDGDTYYEYHKGNQFMISMITYPGGASFSWSKQGCFVNSELANTSAGGGAPTATATPVPPTREPAADAAAMAGSSFAVGVDAPAYLCAPENKVLLPDLSGATLTAQADNTFIFSVGGTNYTLTNGNGIHAFQQFDTNGSILSITMNGFYNGDGMGSYMVVSPDGKSCIAQLTFKPKG